MRRRVLPLAVAVAELEVVVSDPIDDEGFFIGDVGFRRGLALSTSARLREAMAEIDRLSEQLAAARVEIDHLRAERDEQYRVLHREIEVRAEELLLARAEIAKLRARLANRHANKE